MNLIPTENNKIFSTSGYRTLSNPISWKICLEANHGRRAGLGDL